MLSFGALMVRGAVLIHLKRTISGTFWRFKAPYPGLIGPGGVRLPAQQ